jgi:hypothetical protein
MAQWSSIRGEGHTPSVDVGAKLDAGMDPKGATDPSHAHLHSPVSHGSTWPHIWCSSTSERPGLPLPSCGCRFASTAHFAGGLLTPRVPTQIRWQQPKFGAFAVPWRSRPLLSDAWINSWHHIPVRTRLISYDTA